MSAYYNLFKCKVVMLSHANQVSERAPKPTCELSTPSEITFIGTP